MSLVTSDTGAPTLENSGAEHTRQQPQKQLLCQCNPATGQLQPQDTFLLQLCTYKAPKKQTLWFVQTEMWHLLGKELGCNHAKASAHSSFLKKNPRNPGHISLGFYQVQVIGTGKTAKHINMNYFSELLYGFSHKN